MSNFAFLRAEWPELHAEAFRAERAALADPRTACFYARRTLELAIAWLFKAESGRNGSLRMPYKADLAAFLYEPSFQQLVGPALHAKMDVVRKLGNNAVHSTRPVTVQEATAALRELFHVAFWLARHYARKVAERPEASLQFRADLLPRPATTDIATSQKQQLAIQAELQKQAEALAERDAQLREADARRASLDAELAALRAQVAEAKAANAAQPDTHDYDEAATRDLFIDLLLKEAGWALTDARDREYEVAGMPNQQGSGFIDYVLWGDDGKPLAIVEAKRTRRSAKEGEQQAKLYADCIEAAFGQRPVMYGTNGYEHWMWDDCTAPARAVQGFHKKDELLLMVQRRSSRKSLATSTINEAIVERHYQHRAIIAHLQRQRLEAADHHLDRDRHQDQPHQPFERQHHAVADQALDAVGQHQHQRADGHRHAERGDPFEPAFRRLRHQQHHGGQRRWAGQGGNGERHDQRLARVGALVGRVVREDHAQRDEEEHHGPRDLQRQARQPHHPQEAVADEHEGQQQHEGDQHFAQDHGRAPLGRHVAQRVGEDGDVAQRVADEQQQDRGGGEGVGHGPIICCETCREMCRYGPSIIVRGTPATLCR